MYERKLINKNELICYFCNKKIFNDNEDYVNYQLVQLRKKEKYQNKCNNCEIKYPKYIIKELLNRERTGKLKVEKRKPNAIIKIRAYNLYFGY